MKLIYLANISMPTGHTHGIQIMEMCQAFANRGLAVELVVSKRPSLIDQDPFDYYDVKDNFEIKYLPSVNPNTESSLGFMVDYLVYAFSAVVRYLFNFKDIYYTRDEITALALKLTGKNVIWESHMGSINLAARLFIMIGGKIVAISKGLEELYISKGIKETKIIVAPDGADISRFDIELSKDTARKKLNLPMDMKIALYKGQLYKWKGVYTLGEAATKLVDKGIIFVFIGGTETDIEAFKSVFGSYKNIMIVGRVPRQETPIYQKAADVLIIPNTAEDKMSKLYTSPMKLFGYMASGVPIVAADLPSLREVLDESNATFFEPDNVGSLAQAMMSVLNNSGHSAQISQKALTDVEQYSWENRVKKILLFLSK